MKLKLLFPLWIYLLVVLLVVLFLFLFLLYVIPERVLYQPPELHNDGICVLSECFTPEEIKEMVDLSHQEKYKELQDKITSNKRLKFILQQQTGEGYEFHDYIFIIEKSSIYTCHRDANGDFFNDIKYPSYTMIIYLEDMEKCLAVIPQTHHSKYSYVINSGYPLQQVLCKKGDILLFNANLIHAGSISEVPNHLRIQMKYSHKDDIPTLDYYTNYHKILKEESNNSSSFQKINQKISCMVPIISDWNQNQVKKNKNIKTKQDISFIQKWFSYFVYGNGNYYHLPDAY